MFSSKYAASLKSHISQCFSPTFQSLPRRTKQLADASLRLFPATLSMAVGGDTSAMVEDDYDGAVEENGEKIPTWNHEAKLRELLHRLNSTEIKLCSDAAKEFVKLLKGVSGGELLRHYVTTSSRCSELLSAWKLRQGNPGISYVFNLICALLDHPDGRFRRDYKEGIAISRVLDKLARSIIDEHLQDVYKELNGKEFKSQNAALKLMASIVRRGSVLASDIAKNFDFKLKGFTKLAQFKKKRNEKAVKRSSRKAFVGFAMSFLDVGKPGLLRWVLQQKDMYSGVLRLLGNDDMDDDDTVVYVLSTLRDKVLVEESLVPPGLRSVLFGSAVLEQLVEISGRENGGSVAELAYRVLLSVCTDPSNGLMPDLTWRPNSLAGNPRRLLGLMKKLKATEIVYHKDLLLAIVNGRLLLGGAYMEEFPYNLEDFASPNWVSIANLAAEVVSSVAKGLKFDSLISQPRDTVQSTMRCLFPRSFSQSVIKKGLLQPDHLVKSGTLQLLLEGLKLLDSLMTALNRQSCFDSGNVISGPESLKQEIQNEVRMLLPSPQVLMTQLSSLKKGSKRKAQELERNGRKKLKKDITSNQDSDIIICGISSSIDITSHDDTERVESTTTSSAFVADILEETESQLLDALKFYVKIIPSDLDGLFEFLTKLFMDNPLKLPENLQRSRLSLLYEYVEWSSTGIPMRAPTMMSKHLQSFINLLILSPVSDVRNQAYDLAQAAMLSTGAFDRNREEIGSWFLFLPGYDGRKSSFDVSEVESENVVSFLCDAVSATSKSLFKYLEDLKDASPDLSPLVVCILEKCIRYLSSESEKLPKKSISLYVANTLNYILQTQVDPKSLASVLCEKLAESNPVVNDSQWRPLKNLFDFSKTILHQKPYILPVLANDHFGFAPNVVKRSVGSGNYDEIVSIINALSSSVVSKETVSVLSVKKSEWRSYGCALSSLRLLLFWIHQIQSSYRADLSVKLNELTEICFILLKDLLVQLLDSDAHVSSKAAETIFSHPVVSSISHPLKYDMESVNDMDTLESQSKQSVHKFDALILDILVTTTDLLFSLSRENKLVKVFDVLVTRVVKEVKHMFKKCTSNGNLTLLTPLYHIVHALIEFISPFDLFGLVKWMFTDGKVDELIVRKSNEISSTTSFAFCIALGAFRNLSSYLMQPLSRRRKYDMFWAMEANKDFKIVEEIYVKLTKLALQFENEYLDLCLVEAVSVANHHRFHQLSLAMSRIVLNSSVELLSSCIRKLTKSKARLLFLLTDISSVHLSVFGGLFLDFVSKDLNHRETKSPMLLLPAALLYLKSTSVKFGANYHTNFQSIPSFYSSILLKGFKKWKSFVCSEIFEEEFGSFMPSSCEELLGLVNNSLLGKAICMIQYHFALHGDSTDTKKRLKLFDSIFPRTDQLIDCDFGAADSHSINKSLNLINRLIGQISFRRILLFPKCSQIQFLRRDDEDSKDVPLDTISINEEASRSHFIMILVDKWHQIVKKFPPVSDSSKGIFSLYRFLEAFMLRSIVEITTEILGSLLQLKSIPFLEKLMKSALRYRFEDPTTLKLLRNILTVLLDGKFSRDIYLRLLLSHSQFESTIRSISDSTNCSSIGAFSKPMPGILLYLVAHKNKSEDPSDTEIAGLCLHQLEIVKLLGALFSLKPNQSALEFGKSLGIKFRELHLLLLSAYNATLSEMDVEIYRMILAIESIDGVEDENIAGFDYLWGHAASKIDRERALEHDTTELLNDPESVKERRRSQFRENLPIDPKCCTSTVLHFPYHQTTSQEQNNYPERYNPSFILRFSLYSLSVGYIEPMEFASLGLLAISFVSMSSSDEGIRKLAYNTIEHFKNALEQCKKRKDVTRIRLLLTSLQNGIEESWQRIPSVVAIFAAEASFILLDSSHDHYAILSRLLMNSSKLNVKNVPMFNDFFWSVSVNFRAERLWILRLLNAGLNLEIDAQMYTRNTILETLMSFYFSPVSDKESNDLILQIVKKSTMSYKLTRNLVENCGLLPWLSSVLAISNALSSTDEKEAFIEKLTMVLEVVRDVISVRSVSDWLQNEALEQLMELTSHLYRLLVDGVVPIDEEPNLVNSIMEILASTLKISLKRKMYQPHFNLSNEGLYKICDITAIADADSNAGASFGLKAVLMTTPSAAVFNMGREKQRKFLTWAVSAALQEETLGNKASQICLGVISVEEGEHENSLLPKLLRWLTASVILGKLPTKSNGSDPKTSSTLKDLMADISCEETIRDRVECEEFIASTIQFLQQILAANYDLLLPVVSALSILLRSSFSLDDACSLEKLWSKIRFPAEASPSWRWSFYQPWKDLSLDLTDSQKIDEQHACLSLLFIISNIRGSVESRSWGSLIEDMQNVGAFQGEKRLLIQDRVL